MSKIYTINGDSEVKEIPSIEYIHELIKIIEDAIPDNDGFPTIKTYTEELNIVKNNQPIVLARDIKTDSEHKFISDGILATMVDKPSKFEVNEMINSSKEELNKKINETYMRIINTTNVIKKLRDISTILNEDKALDGLLSTMAYKVNMEDFENHCISYTHMNNNDRKALNILIKCLSGGFADWNAAPDEYNSIKNKPESLPANGGNADTIANHNIKDLINKDDYDIIIGSSAEKYSKDSCDIYAIDGNIDQETFTSLLSNLNTYYGFILFKRGVYNIDLINTYTSAFNFNGIDHRAVYITAKDSINIRNSVFTNMTFKDSKVYIGSSCEINNVSFVNCNIILDNTVASNIINCKFDNCTIIYNGSIINNIIKFNRYIRTKPIVYVGGNNIISENI